MENKTLSNITLTEDEINEIRKDAEIETIKKIEDLIYSISQEMRFYASILSRMNKKISYENPIAAVAFENNQPMLYLNPDGIAPFTSRELAFIFVHEIMHITLFHHLRGTHKDKNLFNVAADLEINQLIKSKATKTPSIVLLPEQFDLPEELSAEDYYKILHERGEELKIDDDMLKDILENFRNQQNNEPECTCGESQNEDSNDSSENNNQENSNNNNENTSENDSNKNEDNKDNQNTESGNTDKENCPKCSNKNGNGNGDPNYDEDSIANDYRDLHPSWGKETSSDIEKELVKGMIREAVQKNVGNIPGELEEIIKDLFKPQIDWKKHLKAFKSSVTSSSKKRTWGRPNRRFGMLVPGRIKNKTCNLLVAIDTSASLCSDELMQFLSEIETLSKEDVEITLVQCDTKIQEVVNFNDIDINSFKVKGRGGTSFIPVFELLEGKTVDGHKLTNKPDGLIYLTDGGGMAPDRSGTRVLWVLSEHGHKPYKDSGGHISYGNFTTIKINKK